MIKDDGVRYIGTRHPDWPVDEKKIFPEQQIKLKADKIVDKSYQNTKNKNPFTQIAENAKRELSFRLKDGYIENNAGTARLNSVKEAIDINTALDENVQKQKEADHIKWLKHHGAVHGQTKVPGYPKLEKSIPILQNNINNQKITNAERRKQNLLKTWGIQDGPHNPTVNKYKAFNDKKKKALEEKKFNENFEKEYSDKAIAKWLRAKEHKNRIAGKRPYENFSTENIIVAEDIKDKAKKQLAAIKEHHIKLEPTYIDYRLALKDAGPTISLEEHMAKTAPREIDGPGITALEGAKDFKRTFDTANRKASGDKYNGIGPLLGEYNAD